MPFAFLLSFLLLMPSLAEAKRSRSELLQLKQEVLQHWMAEDGTLLLQKGETVPPNEPFTETSAGNDNGVLFAVEFYWLLDHHGLLEASDKKRFHDLVRKLQVPGYKGLYNRNPGRSDRKEAHDNYVAIVAGSSLFKMPFAKEVVAFGEAHRYEYNNLNPEGLGLRNIASWRQGGEQAFYQLSAGKSPGLRDSIWLFGMFVVGGFSANDVGSGHLLRWLRIKAIEKVMQEEFSASPQLLKSYEFLKPSIWWWKHQLIRKTDGQGIEWFFKLYFGPAHPLAKLAEGVTF